MTQKTKTPLGWQTSGAGGITSLSEANDTPSAEAAQCAKRAAVQAYCHGWLSLESCSQLFRANPDWRAA
jgi:hypothetical protein